MKSFFTGYKSFFFFFLLSIASLFFIGCDSNKTHTAINIPVETDSALYWINQSKIQNTDLQKKQSLLKAYEFNKNTGNDSLKNRHLLDITYKVYISGDTSLFKKINYESYALSHRIKDSVGMAETHWNYASFYIDKEVMDSAYYHYNKANDLYNAIGHDYYSGKMLYNMAFIEGRFKNYTGSEVLTFNAIAKFKPLKKYLNLYRCYDHLGVIYKELEEYDKAIFYYNQALDYLDKVDDKKRFEENTTNNIGLVYQKQGNYSKAKAYFQEALKSLNPKFKNSSLHALLLDNLAYTRLLNGETSEVVEGFQKALHIRDSLNNFSGIIINKLHLAEYYAKNNDTAKAISYANESNNLAQNIHNNRDNLASLKFLAKIDKENAKQHLENYILLRDSLQIEDRKIRNKFTRLRFETDEQVEETKRQAQQKIWISIVSVIFILALSLSYFLKQQRSKNKELLFEAEQQKNNEEIYALMLKQQANLEKGRLEERHRISEELHDGVLGKLFGTRMGIGFLNLKGDPQTLEKHETYIDELQQIEKEIRVVSHELKNEILSSKRSFVDIIESLLESQSKISKYTYHVVSDDTIYWDEIDENIKINLYRILQETLFNINKYAKANKVDVNFKITDKILTLTVQDNGTGFNIQKSKGGIGLTNMRSRTEKLGGEFFISSELGVGTKIEVAVTI